METQYYRFYSHHLGRDMECKRYGHAGRPVLFVPCQDGRFFDFENFKMADAWAPWIESGQVMVFAIDTIDVETWSNPYGDAYWRARRYEAWIQYIVNEAAPMFREIARVHNGWEHLPGLTSFGCSLGATHAANLFFRRPDLFGGVFAISGYYESRDFFGDYMDDLLSNNCPVYYLPNLPQDHFYMDLYRESTMLFVVGQGDWEGPLVESTRNLDTVLKRKGIPARFEYWGYDVAHDWPWWFKMVEHYVPQIL